jgi:hypothetical protein
MKFCIIVCLAHLSCQCSQSFGACEVVCLCLAQLLGEGPQGPLQASHLNLMDTHRQGAGTGGRGQGVVPCALCCVVVVGGEGSRWKVGSGKGAACLRGSEVLCQ